jgi:hypothetical protein
VRLVELAATTAWLFPEPGPFARGGVMRIRAALALILVPFVAGAAPPADRPLSPLEARKRVNEKVSVEMLVRASKNRLEKHKEIYLDSEADFRDKKNLAVVINAAGAAKFKAAGIKEPAGYFIGRSGIRSNPGAAGFRSW